jgi:hypothetical protein
MSLIFDENGRPFIVLRDQDKKKRTKGLEAHKVISRPLIKLSRPTLLLQELLQIF